MSITLWTSCLEPSVLPNHPPWNEVHAFQHGTQALQDLFLSYFLHLSPLPQTLCPRNTELRPSSPCTGHDIRHLIASTFLSVCSTLLISATTTRT